jgi:predicted kinase
MLIAFCGLPGAGKTTLARSLAHRLQATYLRIDTIEDVLLADDGAPLVGRGAGYCVAYAITEDNLKLGRTVIADSVNAIKITREAWREVAKRAGVTLVDVVVTCSDSAQHQSRVVARPPGTRGSGWAEILNREFDAADDKAVVIDTANRTVEQCLAALEALLQVRMQRMQASASG